MDINSCFPGTYLKASDLQGKTVPVIVKEVQLENVAPDGEPEQIKPVVYFSGKDRGLVLNKTNAGTIEALAGSETEKWPGVKLKLYPDRVDFRGKIVDCIRIRGQEPTEAATDEIPF